MGDIKILNDNILFFDIYATGDNLMHVFDKENFTYINSIGRIGGGPNEITSPGFFTVSINTNTVFIDDPGKKRITYYSLDSVKNGIVTPYKFKYYHRDIQIMHPSESNGTFITQAFENSTDMLYSFDDSLTYTAFGVNKINDDPVVLTDYFDQYSFYFVKHLIKELYACTYFNYDVLKILDDQGNVISTTIGPDDVRLSNASDQIRTYRRARPTEDFIVCEYVGDKPFHSGTYIINFAQNLHIFDWFGKPVAKLNLDIPITSFAIDKNRIYALADDDYNSLVYFEIDLDNLD